jgi:glycosyltransferase involved in cell wall biosynthesis
VHVTDWVADFTTPRSYLSWRYVRNYTYRRYRDGGIQVHGIPRVTPALPVRFLQRFNAHLYDHYLQRIIDRHAINAVIGSFAAAPPRARRLIFDLQDDNVTRWRRWGYGEYADEIEGIERAYCQRADAVVAVSSVLAERALAQIPSQQVHLIPNAVELERFERADGDRVRRAVNPSGALVGSIGNNDRLEDLRQIIEVASAFQDQEVTFLIAGRGTALGEARKLVNRRGLGNVVFWGDVPRQQVADFAAAFDVGLCLYEPIPELDASCPIRLLVYQAAGTPVVCTSFEEGRRWGFPGVILVENSALAFIEGIRQALERPKASPAGIERFDIRRLSRQYEDLMAG